MLVESWLSRAARLHPRREAVVAPGRALTYAELDREATDAARALAARGVQPGQRVAIALAPGVDFAVALHGCLRLGAAAVPVDLRLSASERAAVIGGSATLVESSLAGGRGARFAGLQHPHDLDATAVVIHTSGTTAAPRAVELTYGNVLWSALGSSVALGLDPAERWLGALPVAHVGGLSILLRSAIYATTAIVHERFATDTVLAELQRADGPTLVSLVPTTLARLLDAGLKQPPRLRCALIGGAPVPAVLLEQARACGVPVSATYGLTEASSQVTTAVVGADGDYGDSVADDCTTAGPPLFCTRVEIGQDGEILVAGPTIAPAAVADDGWLHTGDLGTLDGAGRLTVSGRLADTIVTGGDNVAPAEVEAVLLEHPAVAEAAVHARPDERWGETVVAQVVLRDGHGDGGGTGESLRAHCAERLAPFKVPKQVRVVSALPRTRSGKLLRRELG